MVGLDPKGARLLKDIFRQFVDRGGTVLMSTHTLEVAEAMCDRIGHHAARQDRGARDDGRAAEQHRGRGCEPRRAVPASSRAARRAGSSIEVLGGNADDAQPSTLVTCSARSGARRLQRVREERAARRQRQAGAAGLVGGLGSGSRRIRRAVTGCSSTSGASRRSGPLLAGKLLGLMLLSFVVHSAALERDHRAVELLPREGSRPARLGAGRLAAHLSRQAGSKRCCTRRGWWR